MSEHLIVEGEKFDFSARVVAIVRKENAGIMEGRLSGGFGEDKSVVFVAVNGHFNDEWSRGKLDRRREDFFNYLLAFPSR